MIESMKNNINYLLNAHGTTCVFRFYTPSGSSSDYDDAVTMNASGTATSGTVLESQMTSEDLKFVDLGIIKYNDKKVLAQATPSINQFTEVDLGTSGNTYKVMNVSPVIVNGSVVYQDLFLRSKWS
jgi:hypothetical protein